LLSSFLSLELLQNLALCLDEHEVVLVVDLFLLEEFLETAVEEVLSQSVDVPRLA